MQKYLIGDPCGSRKPQALWLCKEDLVGSRESRSVSKTSPLLHSHWVILLKPLNLSGSQLSHQ